MLEKGATGAEPEAPEGSQAAQEEEEVLVEDASSSDDDGLTIQ